MDYFGLCLNGLSLVGQSVMHITFVSRLTGKKQKVWCFSLYLLLLCITEWFFAKVSWGEMPAIGIELLILYSITRFALKNQQIVSWVAAIVAIYISQLSFGIVNSVETMIFPHFIGKPLLYLLVVLATLISFVICACCYAAVLRLLPLTEEGQRPYMGLVLLPGLFFFAAERYILHTSYSALTSVLSLEESGKHGALLFLQVLGLGALLCTLYAYHRLCCSFQAETALKSLTQAAKAQKSYIAEAQTRYEQTKAFRHDIKNHLSVLNGLMSSEKFEESKAYLQKLETAATSLSFPYQTGNPVMDILLGEKLGLAKANGIGTEVSLLLPNPCEIDDFDLCVIFANALDNAIKACQSSSEAKFIRITGKQQGDFYLLGFDNTCSAEPLPPMGTGLLNVKTVAEKYHGAMLTEKTGQGFSLHVLLNIS